VRARASCIDQGALARRATLEAAPSAALRWHMVCQIYTPCARPLGSRGATRCSAFTSDHIFQQRQRFGIKIVTRASKVLFTHKPNASQKIQPGVFFYSIIPIDSLIRTNESLAFGCIRHA
jgi:hypothetical protein